MKIRLIGILGLALAVALALGAPAAAKVVGKNPGKIEGRWLDVKDPTSLKGYKGAYLGDVSVDIKWKEERNEQPIDEDLLAENVREQLAERLNESGILGKILDAAPEEGAEDYLRLDCTLEVEPGSRAARYFVGMGAGKSRSIFEIHLRDHASGDELGLYHGYGVGTGMGFKLAGGGARKMTQDDVQENTKNFVKLLKEFR